MEALDSSWKNFNPTIQSIPMTERLRKAVKKLSIVAVKQDDNDMFKDSDGEIQ